MTISRPTHVAVNGIISFFLMAECYSIVYMYHVFFIHSSLGHLGGFLVLSFPGGSAGKESACNVGGLTLIPGLGRSPGEGKGYLFQYSRWRILWTV